jgi:peroxiredoxin
MVYRTYLDQIGPTEALMDTLSNQYAAASKQGDKSMLQGEEMTYDSLAGARKDAIADFVRTHKKSVISAWAIASNFLYYPDPDRLGKLYDELDTAAQRTSYGRKIHEALATARRVAIGKPAPDFTENDAEGKPLSLSSLRGKYVLVDFWASWCQPCRMENPNVVKAFKKYEDDGFTVLGVSLDKDKGAWMKAIRHDHLTWDQVSDLNGWQNAVAREYGVRAIPANFLVGPKGIIVAENLHGGQLEKKLAELLTHS